MLSITEHDLVIDLIGSGLVQRKARNSILSSRDELQYERAMDDLMSSRSIVSPDL